MNQIDQNLAANIAMSEGHISLEIRRVPPEAIRVGMDAAYSLLTLEGIAPCAAFAATRVLDYCIEMGRDNFPNVDSIPWTEWCRRGDLWLDAEEFAVEAALRNMPNGIYEFRFGFEWEGRAPEYADTVWQTFHKGQPQRLTWHYSKHC